MDEVDWKENYDSFAAFLSDEAECVQNEYVDQRRWCTVYDCIYKYHNKYYKFRSEQPSTECQEGGDFNTSEPVEVQPVKKMIEVVEYEPAK